MADGQFKITNGVNSRDERIRAPIVPSQRSNPLSQKISSILSASYVDTEIREALRNLDAKNIQNSPETRRRLRYDFQKEMIDCDGGIISEFGQVAKVCPCDNVKEALSERVIAIRSDRSCYYESEQILQGDEATGIGGSFGEFTGT